MLCRIGVDDRILALVSTSCGTMALLLELEMTEQRYASRQSELLRLT